MLFHSIFLSFAAYTQLFKKIIIEGFDITNELLKLLNLKIIKWIVFAKLLMQCI